MSRHTFTRDVDARHGGLAGMWRADAGARPGRGQGIGAHGAAAEEAPSPEYEPDSERDSELDSELDSERDSELDPSPSTRRGGGAYK